MHAAHTDIHFCNIKQNNMAYKQDFKYVEGTEPHRIRTKAIIAAHPEVKTLIGKNPNTAIIIAASRQRMVRAA